MNSQDSHTRNNSAVFLGERGEQRAVAPLLGLVAKYGKKVDPGVIKALGKLGNEQAVEPIIALLGETEFDGTPPLCIESLCRLGTPRAMAAVAQRFSWFAHDAESLDEAIGAFLNLRQEAVPMLMAELDRVSNHSYDLNAGAFITPFSRGKYVQIMHALGEIGDVSAIPSLLPWLQNKTSDIVRSAAKALASLKYRPQNSQDIPMFLAAVEDWSSLRNLGSSGTACLETAMCSSPNPAFRRIAAEALCKLSWQPSTDEDKVALSVAAGRPQELVGLGYEQVVTTMIAALLDSTYEFGESMAEALGRLQPMEPTDSRVVHALAKAAKDSDRSSVRIAAEKALAQCQERRDRKPRLP